jgi:hypothetical protein
MDFEPTANEIRGNVGLEIGECQEEIGPQGEDLVDVRRCKGRSRLAFRGELVPPHSHHDQFAELDAHN